MKQTYIRQVVVENGMGLGANGILPNLNFDKINRHVVVEILCVK